MFNNKSWLAIIPARGGSKGVAGKNLKELCGKPLIYWCIKAAKASYLFDDIIVSSDNSFILKYAHEQGVKTAKRPRGLSKDSSHIEDAIEYHLKNMERTYDYVQIIEPTAPLLRGSIILKAAIFAMEHNADMVVSVCPTGAPNGIVSELPDDFSLRGFVPKELRRKNRQQVKTRYQLNGMIYIGKWDVFYNNLDWWETDIKAFVMDKDEHVDINDATDFRMAEWILAQRNGLSIIGKV